jgi:hypothetical protein
VAKNKLSHPRREIPGGGSAPSRLDPAIPALLSRLASPAVSKTMSRDDVAQLLDRFVETDDEEEAARLGDFLYAELIKYPFVPPLSRRRIDPLRMPWDDGRELIN